MKILILSPLFPPDTGAPASYVKELAARLQNSHEVSLLVYGYLPEVVEGVNIVSIDKRTFLPVRLFSYTKSMWRHASPDSMLVNNAPSIELPLLLISLFRNIPFVLIESDPIAQKASMYSWYKMLHTLIQKRAQKIIVLEEEALYKKAEVLPFAEFDAAREARRQAWWDTHCKHLLS